MVQNYIQRKCSQQNSPEAEASGLLKRQWRERERERERERDAFESCVYVFYFFVLGFCAGSGLLTQIPS